MSEKTRITEVRIVSKGAAPVQDRDDEAARMTFNQAVKKWAHMQEEVKDLPWSQAPGEMLRDFLKVVVMDLESSYGGHAQRKSMEVIGITLAERGHTQARLSVAWTAAAAGVDLEMRLRPIANAGPVEPGFEFTLEGPRADEEGIRAALLDAARPTPQKRLLLDPVEQVAEEDLSRLMAQVERLVGADKKSQTAALLCAGAVLEVWKHMEKINADTSEVVMEGMHVGEEQIAQGMEVVLVAQRRGLDHCLDPQDEPSREAEQVSTVSTIKLPKH